ncbi:MAG: hypothetical protein ACE5DO_13495 [Desulfobacterales bacterium]
MGVKEVNKDVIKHGNFSFRIDKVQERLTLSDNSEATIIHIKMHNETRKKIYVEISTFPLIIDVFGNQFQSYCPLSGGFTGGDIYPGASVTLSFCWYSHQIRRTASIKQVIVKYSVNHEPESEVIIHCDSSKQQLEK